MEVSAELAAGACKSSILILKVCQHRAANLRTALCAQGFRIWTCQTSRQLQENLDRRHWSMVVIDYPHPVGRGVDICARARAMFDGPVVLVSAPTDEKTQLQVLRTGIDTVIEWPVSAELLGARLRALLRPGSPQPSSGPTVEPPFLAGNLEIDPARREVRCWNRQVELTDLEFDLLILLARNMGMPVSRETLYRELRGLPYDGQDRSMDLRVSRLRKKLKARENPVDTILTVRGTGYQLAAGLL